MYIGKLPAAHVYCMGGPSLGCQHCCPDLQNSRGNKFGETCDSGEMTCDIPLYDDLLIFTLNHFPDIHSYDDANLQYPDDWPAHGGSQCRQARGAQAPLTWRLQGLTMGGTPR